MSEKSIICLLTTLLAVVAAGAVRADETLVTNVYAMSSAVYDGHWLPAHEYFVSVRGGGFINDGMSERFAALCDFVSNRCDEVIADWPAFETNDVARFTVHSAIAFTGFANLTNLAERVLTICESDAAAISDETLRMTRIPYGAPSESENYLAVNIMTPGVSNIIERLRAIAVSRADANGVRFCDECLSGERRRWYLEMKAAGAL